MSARDNVEGPLDMVTYPSSVGPNIGLGAPSQADLPRWVYDAGDSPIIQVCGRNCISHNTRTRQRECQTP